MNIDKKYYIIGVLFQVFALYVLININGIDYTENKLFKQIMFLLYLVILFIIFYKSFINKSKIYKSIFGIINVILLNAIIAGITMVLFMYEIDKYGFRP